MSIVYLFIGITILLVLVAGVWGFYLEPSYLVFNKVNIFIKYWHKEHNNFKVAILTDLHVGCPYINLDKLALLVEKTNKSNPDLIVILGDLVITKVIGGRFIEPEQIAQVLKRLKASQGVVAILGNHDWWYDGNRVRTVLEQVGIIVLENDVVKLSKDEKTFWVAGLADLSTRKPDITSTLAKITDNNPVLMLTHNPDIFPKIPEQVSLTLAGHTHGGQVKLPFLGRPRVPSKFGQRYAKGHIVENKKHLYVSSGVGTTLLPVRFFVPPEIVLLTLNKE